jgi:hypothetical protein
MSDNKQLPDKWRKKIVTQSFSRFPEKKQSAERDIWVDGVNFGAIEKQVEYENKMHQVEQCNAELRVANTKMRNLLEKFISRHEAGLLPDMFIYKEIKTFLDGTK